MEIKAKGNHNLLRPLASNKQKKPLDIGNQRISASINPAGSLNSINTIHSVHGFITLTTLEQFPNEKWYDSDYVRAYRKRMAENWKGFGVIPLTTEVPAVYLLGNDPVFQYDFRKENSKVSTRYIASKEEGKNAIIQQTELSNYSKKTVSIPLQFGGTFSINRCSYGQLTEGGPIPVPELVNNLKIRHNKVSLLNSTLGAQADIILYENSEPLLLEKEYEDTQKEPVVYLKTKKVLLEPGETKVIKALYNFYEVSVDSKSIKEIPLPLNMEKISEMKEMEKEEINSLSFSIERNMNYIFSCCSVPVTSESMCIITDHQLLPLSWNRDSYYMMKFLLTATETSFYKKHQSEIKRLVKGHLIWMFETADRSEGYWGRAYLTNGYCKDKVFQLDQQLYPLLEVCDYYEKFRDKELVNRLSGKMEIVLKEILEYKDNNKWLFLTGETPADDEVIYPFHFSSQLLAWYTFKKLNELNKEFNFFSDDLSEWANKTRHDCLESFTVEHNKRKLFAYLVDLKGNYQLYHDANDLPTVLAPIWGFCEKENPVWKETLNFAFSTQNDGGFYTGVFGGLGSVHTPHKWPLGDGQELLYSYLIGDKNREMAVLEKLKECMLWDGHFSEAVNEQNGKIESRHWFSWPGAFISYVLIMLDKGMVE